MASERMDEAITKAKSATLDDAVENALIEPASKPRSWDRVMLLALIGLTIGTAVIFGATIVIRASQHYAEQMALATPEPSGKH